MDELRRRGAPSVACLEDVRAVFDRSVSRPDAEAVDRQFARPLTKANSTSEIRRAFAVFSQSAVGASPGAGAQLGGFSH